MRCALPAVLQRVKSSATRRPTIYSSLFGTGGKDPAIVMPSADIPLAARAIIRSGIGMTGQACQSLSVFTAKAVYDQLVEELTQVSLTS